MINHLVRRNQPHSLTGFVDQFFGDDAFLTRLGDWPEARRLQNWVPDVDIHEESDAFVLTADLPGMKKEDVEITVEDNTLSFTGERRFEEKSEKDAYRRLERGYGKFTRSFSLPTHVDSARVEARYADGVLTVRVPKTEAARSRKVEIA